MSLALSLALGSGNAPSGGAAAPTIPTTSVTSVAYKSAEYFFSSDSAGLIPVAVPVGYFVEGRPFAVAGSYYIWKVTPASQLVATTQSWNIGGNGALRTAGQDSYDSHGLVKCPWMPVFYDNTWGMSLGFTGQGFDGLYGVTGTTNEAAGVVSYTAGLNIDPGKTSAAIAVAPGDSYSLVKHIRRSGMTTPGQYGGAWRVADNWSVLDIVPTAPPVGAFAQSASLAAGDSERLNYFTLSQMNLNALPPTRSPSSGMPTLATCVSGQYFHTEFKPFFGQFGEYQRRFVVEPGYGLEDDNYSGFYSRVWDKFLSALLDQGPAIADTTSLYRAIAFGIQILGLAKRGALGGTGAGQWCGFKQFVQLVGHLFHASRSGLMDLCLSVEGNDTHQNGWATVDLQGFATESGETANHFANHGTIYPEHVTPARPIFVFESKAHRIGDAYQRLDSNFDADYQGSSSGNASMGALINIGRMKAGPGGLDGAATITGGTTFSILRSAAFAYLDDYRAQARYQDAMWASGSSTMDPGFQATYDSVRDGFDVPRWGGPPAACTVFSSYPSALAAATGGYTWNCNDNIVGGNTDPVGAPSTTAVVEHSLDGIAYFAPSPNGLSGTATSLAKGMGHKVRWNRTNSYGTGPSSVNYPRTRANSGGVVTGWGTNQMEVTPSGSPSGAATNTQAPAIFVKRWPAYWGPAYVAATTPIPDSEVTSTTLYGSVGYWTGDLTAGFSYEFRRDGVAIGGASGSVDLTGASPPAYQVDIDNDLGHAITFAVKNGAGAFVVSSAVNVPALTEAQLVVARMTVAPPAGMETVIDTFVNALKSGATSSSNIWAKLDGVYVPVHNATDSKHNWKEDARNLTYGGTLADADFTAYYGWLPDGVGEWLDTNHADNAAGLNWSQNSASFFCHINQIATLGTANPIIGMSTTDSNTQLIPQNGSSQTRARLNVTTNTSLGSVTTRKGWSGGSRTGSTAMTSMHKNDGGSKTTSAVNTTAAGAPTAGTLNLYHFGASTPQFCNDRVDCLFLGGGLTAAEIDDLFAAGDALMVSLRAL